MSDNETDPPAISDDWELFKQRQRRKRAEWYVVYALCALTVIFFVWALRDTGHWQAYDRGMDQYQRGNYAAAVIEFREYVRYHPDRSLGHYYLARALVKEGNIAEARQEFNKAYQAELQSGNSDPQFANKCKALAEQRDLTASAPTTPDGKPSDGGQ